MSEMNVFVVCLLVAFISGLTLVTVQKSFEDPIVKAIQTCMGSDRFDVARSTHCTEVVMEGYNANMDRK